MREKEVGDSRSHVRETVPEGDGVTDVHYGQSSELLSEETNPNKLRDLQADLDAPEVCRDADIDRFVELYLGNAERDQLDPILDVCVAIYKESLDKDGQVEFKGKGKAFVCMYGFLSSVLPYSNESWERLSIFLNFLILKLPAAKEGISRAASSNHRCESRSLTKTSKSYPCRVAASVRTGTGPALQDVADIQ